MKAMRVQKQFPLTYKKRDLISENDLKKLYKGNTPVFDTNTPYGPLKKDGSR